MTSLSTATMIVNRVESLLLNPCNQKNGAKQYKSKSGVGYCVRFRCAGQHVSVSISGTRGPITALEIVDAITDASCEILRAGPYYNHKGREGLEATLVVGEHYYMLSVN